MILSFRCSCPLMVRGCGWLGTLGNCEDHLDTCSYVYETCEIGCEVVLQREELKDHEKEECPQRIVKCKHCNKNVKLREFHAHLEMCPKISIQCELNCGKEICREDMTQHVKRDCGLAEEKCKRCGKKLTRNELKIHMRDKCRKRKVPCKHCLRSFEQSSLGFHFIDCPKMNVSCALCDAVMYREKMLRHNEQDCLEKKIECLFAKYKCEVIVKRKDLNQHLEEKRTEHLELKLTAMEELIMKQNKTIEMQGKKISEQNQEMEKRFQQLTSLEESKNSVLETEPEEHNSDDTDLGTTDSDD